MKKENLLTAYNYARNSDFVYVEAVSHNQYEELRKKNNLKIINKNDYLVVYKNLNFNLSENDLIFCHSAYISELFFNLKKINNIKKLNLLTCQSDHIINEKLYRKKPDFIKKWYGTNVTIKKKDLFSLPLGIAADFSEKNIHYEDLFPQINEKNRIKKIYCNFNVNTNFNERSKLLEEISKNDLFYIEENEGNIKNYIQKLKKFDFVLCPPGNGPDTHRLWETLYSNSIPIIKNLITHDFLPENSVFKVELFKSLNIIKLNQFLKNYRKLDDKYLDVNFWIHNIKDLGNDSSGFNEKIIFKENEVLFYFFKFKQLLIRKMDRFYKKIRYTLRRLNKFLKLKFIN